MGDEGRAEGDRQCGSSRRGDGEGHVSVGMVAETWCRRKLDTIKIGDTVLERGTDWNPTASFQGNETKENYDLKIIVTNKVKDALEKEDYAVITYDTTSEALSGWYSNFASVSAPGLKLGWPFTGTSQVRCQPRNEARGREAESGVEGVLG